MDREKQRSVTMAYYARCEFAKDRDAAIEQGVKRVDYFHERVLFDGLQVVNRGKNNEIKLLAKAGARSPHDYDAV